ncbi:MAG: hypothetical protein KA455_07570, partial [Brachymonas sp.]|nr:hypothetical protein [Brachymonas sp.]
MTSILTQNTAPFFACAIASGITFVITCLFAQIVRGALCGSAKDFGNKKARQTVPGRACVRSCNSAAIGGSSGIRTLEPLRVAGFQ